MRYTLALAIAAATALDLPVAHAQTEATQAPVDDHLPAFLPIARLANVGIAF